MHFDNDDLAMIFVLGIINMLGWFFISLLMSALLREILIPYIDISFVKTALFIFLSRVFLNAKISLKDCIESK